MGHEITRRGILKALVAVAAVAPLPFTSASPLRGVPEVLDIFSSNKLERFLRSHGIRPGHLSRESAYSRQHLFRLRFGTVEPSLRCVVDLTKAARRITGKAVSPRDLFDLTPADERRIRKLATATDETDDED